MTDTANDRLRFTPLPLQDVTLNDRFWRPRLEVNQTTTLPFLYGQLEKVGAIRALDLQPRPLIIPRQPSGVTPQMWWDSDLAKWIETVAYTLATHPDPALEAQVDALVGKIAAAQGPDGYLNTFFTAIDPAGRLTNERDWHELYNAGHLIEGAVAYTQATGKTTFLGVMERYTRFLMGVYGDGPDQKRGYPGHEEIELALVKLFRLTGRREYLEFARFLVEERGQQPYFFDEEARARGETPDHALLSHGDALPYEYMQAHKPVREQDKVVGHAVRAMYLYSAMADLAAELGDESLRHACERLWEDLTSRRLYITGGLGPSAHNEGMTTDYDLPNDTAYAETCAAVGLVFWAQRMLNLTGDGQYADLMERALYNNVLSSVAQDGRHFFYDNPLESHGDKHRWEWHICPCCPPNVSRLLASLGHYLYGVSGEGIALHLYTSGTARFEVGGQQVTLHQHSEYPWDGKVTLRFDLDRPLRFTLSLRLPGWCRESQLAVNGEAVDLSGARDGYVHLTRAWSGQDQVDLTLPMPVERVYAHPDVRQGAGLVALQRGPIVYCVEGADADVPLHRLALSREAALTATFEPDLLGGATVIRGEVRAEESGDWPGTLYRTAPPRQATAPLCAVPYALWDQREPGEMRVWLREEGTERRPSSAPHPGRSP
ncbi:glycoside hydrolase family 127 protein [Deinococcus aestuarii]|uniref:glycoside hydrolase family 127 protein n=1 Tax=Deinococcus aestuarii TaxID=2774531 RepID=UPI001C0E47B4|nr:beta-L-arabinofuranosidase domain-containing protein [Deinococcus aestuarii]